MSPETVTVLLVDDNEVDVEAVRRAFKKRRIANPLQIASDGAEALERLRAAPEEGGVRLPRVVLLDLNMPGMNGIEFLRNLRADPALKDTVVFVLTTSSRDEDLLASYSLQVAGYVVKSDSGGSFLDLTDMLDSYWRVVELPGRRP